MGNFCTCEYKDGYDFTVKKAVNVNNLEANQIRYVSALLYNAFLETYKDEIENELRPWIQKEKGIKYDLYDTKMYFLMEVCIVLYNKTIDKRCYIPCILLPKGYTKSYDVINCISDNLIPTYKYGEEGLYSLNRLLRFNQKWSEKPFKSDIIKIYTDIVFKGYDKTYEALKRRPGHTLQSKSDIIKIYTDIEHDNEIKKINFKDSSLAENTDIIIDDV